MSISHIPNGFHSVTPYFRVDDGKKFLKFIVDAFDAEIVEQHDREDGTLWHSAAKIFGSMIEASQGSGDYPPTETSIHLYVPDCDAVYKRAIDAGGESIFDVTDMPYGERSGGVKDPCGNHWYIATQKEEMYK
jgi:PhnB protein